MKRDPDLTPLPVWRQKAARAAAGWRRSKDRRRRALASLQSAGTLARKLAISAAGATMISYGVYEVYEPAGYVVGGLLTWALQYNYGPEEGESGPDRR